MRLSSLLALLRPVLPLILGLSLGCSLSLLRVSWIQGEGEDPCVEAVGKPGGPQNPDSKNGLDQGDEDFRPRIVPYYRDPNKPYKKVLRTRYIQTELGSRERLLVAVLTSRATLSTLAVAVNRTGQQYRSFELAKNRDPEKEESPAFLSAFAVHPVPEGTLMYRLHKRFSALELERAYSEIEQLQAQIRNLTVLTPEGEAGLSWPVGLPAPFTPHSRFEVLGSV